MLEQAFAAVVCYGSSFDSSHGGKLSDYEAILREGSKS
jgi:hypothetical protein